MWASMTGQLGRRLSWLQGMFFLLLCVSTIIALYFNIFLKQEEHPFSCSCLQYSMSHMVKTGCLGWDMSCMERDCSKSSETIPQKKCEVSHFYEVLQGGCFKTDDRLLYLGYAAFQQVIRIFGRKKCA